MLLPIRLVATSVHLVRQWTARTPAPCLCRSLASYRWVPDKPVWAPTRETDLPPATKIDAKTVRLLEKLALVDFRTEEGIAVLEHAIRFADELRLVDTTGVQPMTSVLELSSLPLRSDDVTEGGPELGERLLADCEVTREGYWVVPSGNVAPHHHPSLAGEEGTDHNVG